MRVRRLLVRLLVLFAVLLVAVVAAFTWFAYWPLEASVGRVEDLVPADVEFVYRANWREIERTGWARRNVLDHPIHPSFEVRKAIDDLLGRVQADLARINESIPVAALRLDLERDFLSGDLIAAGRFCGGTNPKEGLPTWRELLLLTRATPRLKFDIAALHHGFIHGRAGPDVSFEKRAEFLRLHVKTIRPSDRKARGGCEGGFERPPEDVWFLARVKDVIVFSNSEDLVEKVVALGRGEGARAVDRPGFELKPTTGGVSAVIDVVPLRSYLNRALAGPDAQQLAAFLGRFTTIDAMDRMNATLEPSGPDGARAFADIRHIPSDLHPQVQAAYQLPPTRFADGIARLVPEKDTVLVAHVETPPENLFDALYEALDPGDRRIWDDNIRDIAKERAAEGKSGYSSAREFFAELASKLRTTTGVAIARLSSVYDRVAYADWFSSGDPQPATVLAVVVGIRPALGATAEERRKNVDEFLSDRVRALGFKPPEAAERAGFPYSRLTLGIQIRDFENYKPAYLVFEDRFVLATHEDYLFAILDTMRGGPGAPTPVASTDAFRAVTASLAPDVTLGVYANVAEARAWQWDYRNQWVQRNHPDDRHALKFRAEVQSRYAGRGPISGPDMEKINEEVDREVERYRVEEYPRFIEERRRQLEDLSRLHAFALSITAGGGDVLRGGAVVLLNPPAGASPD